MAMAAMGQVLLLPLLLECNKEGSAIEAYYFL
jgi:hypothetical protein